MSEQSDQNIPPTVTDPPGNNEGAASNLPPPLPPPNPSNSTVNQLTASGAVSSSRSGASGSSAPVPNNPPSNISGNFSIDSLMVEQQQNSGASSNTGASAISVAGNEFCAEIRNPLALVLCN